MVRMVFVGPYLDEVVDYLELSGSSYLVLSFAPSVLTINHSLVPLIFGQCQDPLLQRNIRDRNCLYAANRLAKVVWNPLQNEAPRFYKFIQHFGLTYIEYEELLATYNSRNNSDSDYEAVACQWLNNNNSEDDDERTVYEQKLENIPLKGKHELYIGGIFPIMGRRYRAPELAQGKPFVIYRAALSQ